MSTVSSYPPFYRRRTIGRAASPPTWACYEQIPYENDDCSDPSDDEDHSCSEDGEDYHNSARHGNPAAVHDSDSDDDDDDEHVVHTSASDKHEEIHDMEMEMASGAEVADVNEGDDVAKKVAEHKKDVKGKQRAIDTEPEPKSPKRQQRRKRESVITLRPILTIQRSQGFVWNQDLFVPPYIKDRYVASTSPPNVSGFIATPLSTNSCLNDYEIEVVEIRVKEGELKDIIP